MPVTIKARGRTGQVADHEFARLVRKSRVACPTRELLLEGALFRSTVELLDELVTTEDTKADRFSDCETSGGDDIKSLGRR